MEDVMNRIVLGLSCAIACASASLLPTVATAETPVPRDFIIRTQAQCQERVGPFATQDRAYQIRRQAQSRGYSVSGVIPCDDGFCFNVFHC
jgi:hypothetical protein